MNETVNVSKGKRILSLALSISLVLSNLPCSAFATEQGGLCSHHRSHTEDCGYSKASSGSPCTHEHTLDCYEIVECVHECDEDCEEYGCTHVCSEESGCITRKLDCHHVHDDTCGYSEGTPASPCRHVHDETCGYVEAVAEVLCDCSEVDENGNLVHEEGCGYVAPVEGSPCSHVHDENCGYAEATEGTPCQHVCRVIVDSEDSCYALLCSHAEPDAHDETCGYVAPNPGNPCQYVCTECGESGEAPEETESTETTETTTATEEMDPTETTEETQPEQVDEAVEAVRAMVAALPNVSELEAMDSDAQNAAYQAAQNAWDAFKVLTEEQQDELKTEFDKLCRILEYCTNQIQTTDVHANGSYGITLWFRGQATCHDCNKTVNGKNIDISNISLSGNTLYVSCKLTYTCGCIKDYTSAGYRLLVKDFSCTKNYSESRMSYEYSQYYSIGITFSRNAGHSVDSWTVANNQHTGYCNLCKKTITGNCSGGTATCSKKAVCATCGKEYGAFADHNYILNVASNGNGQHTGNCEWCSKEGTVDCSFDNNGICSICGGYQPAAWNSSNNCYEISNYGQLLWYGAYGSDKNGFLLNDLKIGQSSSYYMDWPNVNVGGSSTFDGNHHTIEMYLTYSNVGGDATRGVVGLFSAASGATIQNLTLKGEINCNISGPGNNDNPARVGAVSGSGYGLKLNNILSCVNVANTGTGPTGGLVGYFGGGGATINNCAVYANVQGASQTGGLVGAGWNGNQSWTIKNSAFYGTLQGGENKVGAMMGYSETDGGVSSSYVTNCYYSEGYTSLGGQDRAIKSDTGVTKTAEQFSSGEVCWLLNNKNNSGTGVWKQAIGSAYPTFTGTDVYAVEGAVASIYTNDSDIIQENDSGYYEIYSKKHLIQFGEFVNLGNKDANGILMADIDLSGTTWTPICTTGLYYDGKYTEGYDDEDTGYAGTFDGNCHVIKNLSVSGNSGKKETYGLFGTLSQTGTIQNLGIEKFTFNLNGASDIRTGAIVGQILGGTVSNCYVCSATITPNNYVVGGIAGCNYAGTIENCHAYDCTLSGTTNRFGWIVGDNRADGGTTDRPGTLRNCYTNGTKILGERTGTQEKCEANASAKFQSGEVTWLLNGQTDTGIWKQTLSAQAYPTFSGETVYHSGSEYFNSNTPSQSGGYYLISNAAELLAFAQIVNSGNKNVNGKLTADIDMSGISWDAICSTGLYYSNTYASGNYEDAGFAGTFDGNYHVIKNLCVTSASGVVGTYGLFGSLSGTVKNLGIEGFTYIHKASDMRVGAIAGQVLGGTIQNCYVTNATINPGTNVVGGIAASNYAGRIENCHVYNSKLQGTSSGSTIRYGWIVADNRADTAGDRVGAVVNCYTDGSRIVGSYSGTETDCQANVGTKFTSGEVTYLLNGKTSSGVWKQTIDTKTAGTDSSGTSSYPVFDGMPVYQMRERYVNYAPPATNSDGWFDIKTAENLMAFAQYVNLGTYNANAVVTSDISLSSYAGKWVPIARTTMGNDVSTGFTGTFDGQGHTISDISFGTTTEKCTNGLFGTIYKGGVVKHIGITKLTFDDNTYDHRAGGIAGQLMYGGRIENCFVADSTIKASSRVVGGIAAMNLGTIENCYTRGLSLAAHTNRFGGICGDYKGNSNSNNENGKVINCYTDYATLGSTASDNMGTATNSEAGVTVARFASGEITYLLNQKSSENPIWYQKLGSENYPVFTGSTVYYGYRDCLSEGAEYANTELNPDQSHSYTLEPEFRWSEDDKTCTAIFTCALDSSHDTCEVPCEMSFDTSNSDETICTASVTMNGKTYSDSKIHQNTIISVNVSWSEMEFDYTDGEWNAETHEYAVGTWTPKTENGDTLTISNAGNVKLDVAVSYEQAENSGIEGTVRVESSETNAFTLELEEEKRISLSLSGKPAEHIQHELLGTIVLRLKRVDTDSQNVPDVSGTE